MPGRGTGFASYRANSIQVFHSALGPYRVRSGHRSGRVQINNGPRANDENPIVTCSKYDRRVGVTCTCLFFFLHLGHASSSSSFAESVCFCAPALTMLNDMRACYLSFTFTVHLDVCRVIMPPFAVPRAPPPLKGTAEIFGSLSTRTPVF